MPAGCFYEWLCLDDEKVKVPFDIQLKDGRPFVMASIYEAKQKTVLSLLRFSPRAQMN